jgi:hypothetical protein
MKEHVEWCVMSRTLSERRDKPMWGRGRRTKKLVENHSWVMMHKAAHITSESRSEGNTVSLSILHERSACTCSLRIESPEIDLFPTRVTAKKDKYPEL